ncbi:hypothetical protein OYE22_10385 [Streptomyces sp. 71268]|uniref:hypothetical protein n=1 Tax=Streptomyces sp. 71268 TaxID=3002640 RepID=UPI0023F68ED5|nr:hypothetical protein [Streptomyces sp. 71268]WEV25549.1 hypothetical protein OYE22_10385 [Streptomyces sp. 71268]
MSLPFLRNRARRARAGVACAVLLALIGYATAHVLTGGGGPPRCVVRADGERLELDPEQSRHAATIAAVAASRGLPDRAVTIALATAMQESGLHNIRRGDRDSLGLFQQRPSQGWGTTRQILDPVYASGKFFDDLVKVPGYSRLPLTVAAQRVQFSGFPQAYAKHEAKARLLTASLTGHLAGSFRCPALPDDGEPGDPRRLRALIAREFGPVVGGPSADGSGDQARRTGNAATELGGIGEPDTGAGRDGATDGDASPTAPAEEATGAAGPPGPGARPGTADGDAGSSEVRVPVRTTAPGGDPRQRGWELAHWALAHAGELRIARISFDGREWSASASEKGWRTVSRKGAHSGDSAAGNSRTEVRIELAR